MRKMEKILARQKARALVNNCFFRIRLFSPTRMHGVITQKLSPGLGTLG